MPDQTHRTNHSLDFWDSPPMSFDAAGGIFFVRDSGVKPSRWYRMDDNRQTWSPVKGPPPVNMLIAQDIASIIARHTTDPEGVLGSHWRKAVTIQGGSGAWGASLTIGDKVYVLAQTAAAGDTDLQVQWIQVDSEGWRKAPIVGPVGVLYDWAKHDDLIDALDRVKHPLIQTKEPWAQDAEQHILAAQVAKAKAEANPAVVKGINLAAVAKAVMASADEQTAPVAAVVTNSEFTPNPLEATVLACDCRRALKAGDLLRMRGSPEAMLVVENHVGIIVVRRAVNDAPKAPLSRTAELLYMGSIAIGTQGTPPASPKVEPGPSPAPQAQSRPKPAKDWRLDCWLHHGPDGTVDVCAHLHGLGRGYCWRLGSRGQWWRSAADRHGRTFPTVERALHALAQADDPNAKTEAKKFTPITAEMLSRAKTQPAPDWQSRCCFELRADGRYDVIAPVRGNARWCRWLDSGGEWHTTGTKFHDSRAVFDTLDDARRALACAAEPPDAVEVIGQDGE